MRRSGMGMKKTGGKRRRRAAAAVELALLLPVLCSVAAITIDYSRLFFHWTTITVCAYNGAYYASTTTSPTQAGLNTAALADATDLTNPSPTVSPVTSGTDGNGNAYVEITVSYTFQTQFPCPGMPTSVPLIRKLRMAVTPP